MHKRHMFITRLLKINRHTSIKPLASSNALGVVYSEKWSSYPNPKLPLKPSIPASFGAGGCSWKLLPGY